MILVAIAVVFATAVGISSERRFDAARPAARQMLRLMLYVMVPFVSFVNIAHLRVTVGAGVGLGFAWLVVLTIGAVAFALGRFWLRLPDPQLGALICGVIVVNTGYLGLPMAVALLHTRALASAVAYDQLVSGPALFGLAFGVGAAFGERSTGGWRPRAKVFFTRNPPLVAVLAGLVAPPSLAPAPLPAISHVVVAALLLLGFFAVGVNLSSERRADDSPLLERPDRRVAVAVGLRVLAAPLLLGGLSAVFVTLPSSYLLQAAMPTGISSLVVGQAYGLDQRLLATTIVWSTTLTLLGGLVLAAL